MRLFVALPLDETMRDALCRAMEDLRAAGVRGRFSHRENLHLTLAFLGETPRLAQACRAVAGVEAPAFDLRLETFGLFRRQEGSILWAGLTPSAPLLALQRQVAGRLADAGFVLENRPFSPHLTLARQAQLPGGRLPGAVQLPRLSARADRVVLFESTRQNGRLVYLPRQTRTLAQPLEGTP